jgi:hypothetical protein
LKYLNNEAAGTNFKNGSRSGSCLVPGKLLEINPFGGEGDGREIYNISLDFFCAILKCFSEAKRNAFREESFGNILRSFGMGLSKVFDEADA